MHNMPFFVFVQVGYKKEKLNPETYAYLMEWYNEASRSRKSEKWAADNTYVNHWKVDTIMVHAPSRVRDVRVWIICDRTYARCVCMTCVSVMVSIRC